MRFVVGLNGLLLSTFLLVTGCGFVGGITDHLDQPSTKPIVLGDYLYQTVGSCADGSLLFKVLQTSGIQLWTDPLQPIIVGMMEVYLFDTGKYVVRYWEYTGDTKSTIEQIEGTYTLSADSRTLVMSDFGTANFFELNNKFGLALTPTRDIITPGMANKQYLTRSVLIDSGLETFNDVCPQ